MTPSEQIGVIRLFNSIANLATSVMHGATAMDDGTVIAWVRVRGGKKQQLVFGGSRANVVPDTFQMVCDAIADAINGGSVEGSKPTPRPANKAK